jgi:hypothetical protein
VHNLEKLSKLLGYFDDTPRSNGIKGLPTAVGTTRKAAEMLDYSLLSALPARPRLTVTPLPTSAISPASQRLRSAKNGTKAGLDLELVGVNCGRQMFVTDTKWETLDFIGAP